MTKTPNPRLLGRAEAQGHADDYEVSSGSTDPFPCQAPPHIADPRRRTLLRLAYDCERLTALVRCTLMSSRWEASAVAAACSVCRSHLHRTVESISLLCNSLTPTPADACYYGAVHFRTLCHMVVSVQSPLRRCKAVLNPSCCSPGYCWLPHQPVEVHLLHRRPRPRRPVARGAAGDPIAAGWAGCQLCCPHRMLLDRVRKHAEEGRHANAGTNKQHHREAAVGHRRRAKGAIHQQLQLSQRFCLLETDMKGLGDQDALRKMSGILSGGQVVMRTRYTFTMMRHSTMHLCCLLPGVLVQLVLLAQGAQ